MSSYCEVYLNSIKNKLDTNEQNGVFVLSVDPWSIMASKDDPENVEDFPDYYLPLAKINPVGHHPNFHYLLRWYKEPYFNLWIRRFRPSNEILHKKRWLEVRVPMENDVVSYRLKQKQRDYSSSKIISGLIGEW